MSEMSTKKTLPPGKFQLRNEHFTFKPVTKTLTKGLAKLGSLVSETLVQTKIFHSLASREKNFAEANFGSWKQGNVSESSQKNFCFTDANFVSETYVSQFSHPRTHEGNMSGNNVSATKFPSLARP